MHNAVTVIRVLRRSALFLGVFYVGLLAVTVFYASLRVEFADAFADQSARVGELETRYQSELATIAKTNPALLGYAKPVANRFAEAPAGLSSAR